MRRWICLLVLLSGFAGQGEIVAARSTEPVPIERPLMAARGGRLERTAAWWRTT